jgi:hypothetical protein
LQDYAWLDATASSSSWLEFTPLRAVFGSIQPEPTITVK